MPCQQAGAVRGAGAHGAAGKQGSALTLPLVHGIQGSVHDGVQPQGIVLRDAKRRQVEWGSLGEEGHSAGKRQWLAGCGPRRAGGRAGGGGVGVAGAARPAGCGMIACRAAWLRSVALTVGEMTAAASIIGGCRAPKAAASLADGDQGLANPDEKGTGRTLARQGAQERARKRGALWLAPCRHAPSAGPPAITFAKLRALDVRGRDLKHIRRPCLSPLTPRDTTRASSAFIAECRDRPAT